MSDSPYRHFETLDPEWAAVSSEVPSMADSLADPVVFRNTTEKEYVELSRQRTQTMFDGTKFKSTDHSISVASGTAVINVRIIVPADREDVTFPLLYWIHGGCFIMGSIEFNTPHLIPLVLELNIAVALVDYRLTPEHPHPTQVNDSLEGLKWVTRNAASLQIDISKGFIVGGESAGGALVASITHYARDDPFFNGRRLTGQILHIPCTVDPRAYPEKYKSELRSLYMTEHAEIAGLTRPLVEDMYAKFLQNDPSDYTISPLLWPSHANLPPAFVQVAGLDLLRDEGLIYERALREAGNKTRLTVYPGVPHGHHMLYENLSATKKFNADFRAGLTWLLSGAET